jgi:DNA-binding response OmpR family regulator
MLSGRSDGLSLLATVRAHPEWFATKVIMLTARGAAEDRAASAALGADAYFTKPFSPIQLNDCIDELLSAEPTPARDTHRFDT